MKIYVAGHGGLVGSAIVRKLEADGIHTWIGKTRSELDLLDRKATFEYLAHEKPDAVIVAAAKVGGIGANYNYPVDFLSQNLQLETNLIDGSHAANIERLVFLGSSCVYPKLAPQPIQEEYLLTGKLEVTNEPYAIAKIAGLKLVQAYRKQFGHKWISVMPTNVYGPGDNFDLETSHVLPALIHKFHLAKEAGSRSVTLWGTGSPQREFLYADDLAEAVIFSLENYDDTSPVNIGVGEDISIKSLAQLIAEVVGYKGDIEWDITKPDGTPRKLLDLSKINALGWHATTPLIEGVQASYAWFVENIDPTNQIF
jgi:GDP-L-fucose synthase